MPDDRKRRHDRDLSTVATGSFGGWAEAGLPGGGADAGLVERPGEDGVQYRG
uniref:hypothetical protein n=1 Tax=Paractinoplanes polyasparticus TaxID=2856853 RepID=UPI001C864697|nr:hypothetical protein [Actinoplanes polyasparticus]